MEKKSRKVNIVAYYDEPSGSWQIIIVLPEVALSKSGLTPSEAVFVADCLLGDRAAFHQTYRVREMVAYLRRNVDADVLPEVGRQLNNLATMASQGQAGQTETLQ